MTQHFDVAVIGGGIQGAGVAQAAAAAGYSVIVFEQSSIASGTSSRSSKLIHGGLRYLESAQFGLVRKALKERSLLVKLAPDLVKLVPFNIPIYKSSHRRPWQIRAGLSLYALLGNLAKEARFKKLSTKQWSELDGLNTNDLQAVYQYYDAQTDDVALTNAVMNSAVQLGATLCCPAKLIQLQQKDKRFQLVYEQQGQQHECSSTVVINAAGPWVNQVLSLTNSPQLDIELVQGSHLILDQPASTSMYYVEAPQDHRAVFIMPWKNKTMIGTTEHAYHGDPAKVTILAEEQDYLLKVYQHYFPNNNPDVLSSFAGLRVLPITPHSHFHRPRDTIIYSNPTAPGLVSLYGGKLTGYRATSQQLMQQLQRQLPEKRPIADTGELKLV